MGDTLVMVLTRPNTMLCLVLILVLLLHNSIIQPTSLDVSILMNVSPEETVMLMQTVSTSAVDSNANVQLTNHSEMVLQDVSLIQMTLSPLNHQLLLTMLMILQPQLLQLLLEVVLLLTTSTVPAKECSAKLPMLPTMLPSHALEPHVVSNVLIQVKHQAYLVYSVKILEKQRNKDGRTVTRNSVLVLQSLAVPLVVVHHPVVHQVHPMVSVE